eukprot:83939-Hanusia_phi.AAC.10
MPSNLSHFRRAPSCHRKNTTTSLPLYSFAYLFAFDRSSVLRHPPSLWKPILGNSFNNHSHPFVSAPPVQVRRRPFLKFPIKDLRRVAGPASAIALRLGLGRRGRRAVRSRRVGRRAAECRAARPAQVPIESGGTASGRIPTPQRLRRSDGRTC